MRVDTAGLDCAVLRDPGDASVNGLLGLATAYVARTGGQSKRVAASGGGDLTQIVSRGFA
ncbi:hypothetical protein [Actinacidiphila oryziradicis]|uniref:Uncharacterized protein n=1 Tax=Actinacidiphila oryziradicis TaxID=2571141 RepID=A0A4V5MYM2_9ACTN|nr:hypothetical protein [Actinacidiphila oryziradicis]TKA04779.1 hypothetical protein FCI23_34555 [Actinacidiphila oryziradicis]